MATLDGERGIAQCTRRLIAALAEPESTDVEALVERMRDEASGNEPAGRRWVAAVRRVQASGKLESDEADSIVNDVATAIMSDASTRDAELGRLAEQLKPLHELHGANWDAYRAAKEKAGEGFSQPEPVYPDGLGDLMKEYSVRYGVLYGALLDSLGESAMASEHREDDNAHLWRMIRGAQALAGRSDMQPGVWRVTFVAPEDVPLPPLVSSAVNVYAADYEEKLEQRLAQWMQATGEEKSIWTVPSVLDFATIGSYQNADGDGDLWIKSVQRAREAGAVDLDLSWLLIDRITSSMIPGELDDSYQADLVEKFWDVEDEYGNVDEDDDESVKSAPEAWKVLNRARNRRLTMLQVRVLRAAGEDEMARMLEEQPDEFARRMEQVAGIWEVEA